MTSPALPGPSEWESTPWTPSSWTDPSEDSDGDPDGSSSDHYDDADMASIREGAAEHRFPRLMLLALIAAIIIRPWDFVPALQSIKPVTLGLLSITAYLMATGVSIHFLRLPLSKAMIVLWVCMLLGVFNPYTASGTADFAIKYVQYLILFGLLGTLVDSIAGLKSVVRTIVVVGGVLGMLAVRADMAGMVSEEGRIEGLGDGMLSDPNDLACMLVTIGPLGLLWMLSPRFGWLDRLISLGAMGSMGLGILVTQSRGGMLAVVAGGAFLLAVSKASLGQKLLVAAMAGMAFLAVVPDSVLERYSTIATAAQTDESAQSRVAVWGAGMRIFADHPILGIGVTNFEMVYGSRYIDRVGAGDIWRSAHNAYVEAIAELGIIGFTAWAVFIFGGVPLLWRRHRSLLGWLSDRGGAGGGGIGGGGLLNSSSEDESPAVADAALLSWWTECAMASLIAFLAAATFLSKGFDIDTVIFIGTAVAGCRLVDRFLGDIMGHEI